MYQNNQRSFVPASVHKTLFSLTFFFITFLSIGYAQTMQTSQVSKYTRIETNVGGYLESLPNDYSSNPTKKYPLLIALHGVGERGNGSPGLLEVVANVGIAKRIKTGAFPASFTVGGKSFSFIVISPQMETAGDWTASIQAVIDYCKKNYRVDEQRIYLTGLSLGGISEWIYVGRGAANGENLAAALLVCPGANYNANQLKNVNTAQLPIWVTNNSGDPYNPASGATALVDAINGALPAHPKALITIFNATGHDAWTQTYDPAFKQDGLNVYEWMLSHTRGSQGNTTTPVLTANAGADQILTLPTNTLTLDASASSVTSGTITSYSWTKVSGPATGLLSLLSSGLQAKLTDLVTGTYVYQLTVKDSNGSTATDNVTVTVNTSTNPPTANAGSNQTITLPANTTTLDGSASVASSGNTITSYQWSKATSSPSGGDIATSTSAKTTISNLIAGTYTYTLLITDSRGSTQSATTVVTVNPAAASTDPPTANAGANQIITLPVNTTTLDGSASTASTGNTIKSYQWSKATSSPSGGDIATPTSAKTTISNLIAGTYTYTLLITDSRGSTKSANTVITVNPATASTDPPTANAGKGQTITLPVNTATLDGSYSKASAGNTIVSYKWTKGASSPAGGDITSPTTVKTTITNLIAGTYTYSLLVTDNRGATRSGGTTVIVNAAVQTTAPPTANAGYGGILTLPSNSITLNGFLSKAATGSTITSYAWSKYSGPSTYTIATPNAMQTNVTSLVAGIYVFALKVTDNYGLSSSANVQVTVKAAASGRMSETVSAVSTDELSLNPVSNRLLSSEFDVSLGQNPVQSDLNVKLSGTTAGKASILVYNTAGQLQLQQEFRKEAGAVSKGINISRLPAGIYIVHIMIDEKHRKVLRVVKQ
ncbi:MAG: T9SS type A sorting domain-containing protein [Agriterribacter sp.]